MSISVSEIPRKPPQDVEVDVKTCGALLSHGSSLNSARLTFPPRSLSSTLSRSGRSRRAPRDTGGESGVRPRGGRSQSLSGCISSSLRPSSLAGGVTRSRDHWVRLDSRALAYVRSIDQSVGRSVAVPTDREIRLWRSRDCAAHNKHTYTQIRTRSSHVSGFSSRLDIQSSNKL